MCDRLPFFGWKDQRVSGADRVDVQEERKCQDRRHQFPERNPEKQGHGDRRHDNDQIAGCDDQELHQMQFACIQDKQQIDHDGRDILQHDAGTHDEKQQVVDELDVMLLSEGTAPFSEIAEKNLIAAGTPTGQLPDHHGQGRRLLIVADRIETEGGAVVAEALLESVFHVFRDRVRVPSVCFQKLLLDGKAGSREEA